MAPVTEDRRIPIRVSLGGPAPRALVESGDAATPATLVDLSPAGARVRVAGGGAAISEHASLARLSFGVVRADARVVWCSAGELGLRFEEPLRGFGDLVRALAPPPDARAAAR